MSNLLPLGGANGIRVKLLKEYVYRYLIMELSVHFPLFQLIRYYDEILSTIIIQEG